MGTIRWVICTKHCQNQIYIQIQRIQTVRQPEIFAQQRIYISSLFLRHKKCRKPVQRCTRIFQSDLTESWILLSDCQRIGGYSILHRWGNLFSNLQPLCQEVRYKKPHFVGQERQNWGGQTHEVWLQCQQQPNHASVEDWWEDFGWVVPDNFCQTEETEQVILEICVSLRRRVVLSLKKLGGKSGQGRALHCGKHR